MNKFYKLVEEDKSPLHRISFNNTKAREFEASFLTAHIGNGYFITVNHPLNGDRLPKEIDGAEFSNILKTVPNHKSLLNKYYLLAGNKVVLNTTAFSQNQDVNEKNTIRIMLALKEGKYDISYLKEFQRGLVKPSLVITFKNNLYYSSQVLTNKFGGNNILHESLINRTSFLIDLELVFTSYENDLAVYKAINVDKDIIDIIPSLDIDYSLLDFSNSNDLFCLQCSPNSDFGRTLNKSCIEGIVDSVSNITLNFPVKIHEGKRYLLKTYYRFGSSGAPYIFYDEIKEKFVLNAIQSEGCGIQMDINGNRNNMQFTNAIATPLFNIKDKLCELVLE